MENGGIETYTWIIDERQTISNSPTAEHTFRRYGDHNVQVELVDFIGNSITLEERFTIYEPVELDIETGSEDGVLEIMIGDERATPETYDVRTNTYMFTDIAVPMRFLFDGRDVRVKNPLYTLNDVRWDGDGDGEYEINDDLFEYNVNTSDRHTVSVQYTFYSEKRDDRQTVEETIVIDAEEREIYPRFTIEKTTSYVPVLVTVDASASSVSDGAIAKYIVDFGESGRPPQEGDARQNYRYMNPGTYDITVTVVRDDGERESATQKLVLKKLGNRIVINTSVSSGLVGRGVDFDAAGSVGQIESYYWKFGDGTVSVDSAPTHSYQETGEYTVSLRATFADGSVQEQTETFRVE